MSMQLFNTRNWLDDFMDTPFRLLMQDDERLNTKDLNRWIPQCDISETNDKVKITANLPGMKKEDIKIDFDDESRMLNLSGEYKQEKKEDKERFHRIERRYGNFYRSIQLPNNVDADHISANVKDGVLYVEVPKVQEKKKTGRMISIQ